MALWEYIILFGTVILGGGIAFFVKSENRNLLQTALSFSGAFILGISVLHLMPVIYSIQQPNIGLWIIGGFFIQLLLEQLSAGVEHGHIHVHSHQQSHFALQVMFGLCVHAFVEGMPLNSYHHLHHDHGHGHHLLFGIILHKAPAAFALVLLFLLAEYSKKTVFMMLLIFASMSPLGAALSGYLGANNIISTTMNYNILAFVLGSFLHIATTILFETDNTAHHNIPKMKLIAIIFGLGMAILTMH